MRTFNPPSLNRSSVHFLFIVLTLFLAGCSGYQSVSYYGDGIYDEEVIQQPRQVAAPATNNTQQNSGSYYKSYFADKASQGIQDDYMFTDVDQYQDATPLQNSAGNYQSHGSWGDQVDRININVIYNRPFGWNWYYAPFNYGRASFWGYNYHPWYFTFNHHPFYNPYRWGYRNPYYGSYWNNWGYNNPYYRPGINQGYAPVRYSRLNGSRGLSRTNLTNRTTSNANNRAGVSNNNTKRRTNTRGTTTTRRVSGNNNSTQRYNDSDNSTNSSQNKRTTRRYTTERTTSSNNSSYRSSSSSSNSSYRRSTPSSSTRSTSSSSSRSSGSSRRR